MTDVSSAVITRLKSHGHTFEVLVDCNKAIEYKKGVKLELNDILAVPEIFKDSKKGEKISEHELSEAFNTTDRNECIKQILEKGEVQLTAEYRKKLIDEKKKKIMDLIVRNAVDSKTNLPHPLTRIELAMEHAKISIDPFKEPNAQLKEIVKKLAPILPISLERRTLEIRIPPKYAASVFGVVQKYGEISKQTWGSDGSWLGTVIVPAGLQDALMNSLNKLTHGDVYIKIMESEKLWI
ncbi:MAG: ribosome assembly factor SBDS [Candidatus Nanoarchaeia archaeon]|nr:ribosome assembly factor SBDS [Candidatus Nanoarchaeia archaeon]